ncbi:hypothetical protein ACLPJK_26310 [Pseudomonas aeruginosa]|uniref:hypothetical protein n=1 Tax=Pseudomonas aeruginosa TaxID=287 RepID=UPI003D2B208A
MSYDLSEVIGSMVGEELLGVYNELAKTLSRVGPTLFEDELEYLKSLEEDIDTASFVDSVDTILRVAADRILSKAGIVVDGETPIPMLNMLLLALKEVPEDHQDQLEDVLSQEEGAYETLLDFLSVVTVYDDLTWMPYILSVSDLFIEQLTAEVQSIAERTAVLDEATRVDQGAQRPVVKALREVYGKTELDQALRDGVSFGTSMESLLPLYGDRLSTSKPSDMVLTLVSLCALSCESLDAVVDECEFFLPDFYPDLDTCHAARQRLSVIAGQLKKRMS